MFYFDSQSNIKTHVIWILSNFSAVAKQLLNDTVLDTTHV